MEEVLEVGSSRRNFVCFVLYLNNHSESFFLLFSSFLPSSFNKVRERERELLLFRSFQQLQSQVQDNKSEYFGDQIGFVVVLPKAENFLSTPIKGVR